MPGDFYAHSINRCSEVTGYWRPLPLLKLTSDSMIIVKETIGIIMYSNFAGQRMINNNNVQTIMSVKESSCPIETQV